MKYYLVNVLLEIPDEIYNGWDSSCDETFHGPGRMHSPTNGIHVIEYEQTNVEYFNLNKNNIFTEEGGI